jgi:hypothetical protein
MAAFMQAPDYVQWHGFYELLQDREEIEHMAEEIREAAHEEGDTSEDVNFLLVALGIFLLIELVVIAILLSRRQTPELPE